MSDMQRDLLDMRFGRATVREHLERAVANGRLVQHADGSLELAQRRSHAEWMRFENAPHPPCAFLHQVLFEIAYDRTAVPFGCRDCYKVKVSPTSIAALVKAKDVGAAMSCRSKWGPEVDIPYSTSRYGGFLYAVGLDRARALYKEFNAGIKRVLGAAEQMAVFIKRGCTDYEVFCGPSNAWTFHPDLEALERTIAGMFRLPVEHQPQGRAQTHAAMATWIHTAHRMGDQTYLELTGGRSVYPAPVSYAPDAD